MRPLAPFGLAIVINAAVLAGGLAWTRRQVKRVAVERAAEYRGLFVLEPPPQQGREVQILVDDESGMPAELDAIYWPSLGWVDAKTLLPVEEEILGWRSHPFRERKQDDPQVWSDQKLAAELKRLCISSE